MDDTKPKVDTSPSRLFLYVGLYVGGAALIAADIAASGGALTAQFTAASVLGVGLLGAHIYYTNRDLNRMSSPHYTY